MKHIFVLLLLVAFCYSQDEKKSRQKPFGFGRQFFNNFFFCLKPPYSTFDNPSGIGPSYIGGAESDSEGEYLVREIYNW